MIISRRGLLRRLVPFDRLDDHSRAARCPSPTPRQYGERARRTERLHVGQCRFPHGPDGNLRQSLCKARGGFPAFADTSFAAAQPLAEWTAASFLRRPQPAGAILCGRRRRPRRCHRPKQPHERFGHSREIAGGTAGPTTRTEKCGPSNTCSNNRLKFR